MGREEERNEILKMGWDMIAKEGSGTPLVEEINCKAGNELRSKIHDRGSGVRWTVANGSCNRKVASVVAEPMVVVPAHELAEAVVPVSK